jgi:predicted nucleic acid-binding protein
MSAAIRHVSPIRDRIRETHRKGIPLGTCWPVLCELEFGIIQTGNPEAYRRTLHALLGEIRIWPYDWPVVRLYGSIAKELQSRGRALTHVDILLATMASHMDLTILTTDRDFESIPTIRTDNWLADAS